MKKNFIYLWVFIVTVGLLNSCDDYGDEKENLMSTWYLNQTNAMHITWESSENISINGISMPVAGVAELMAEYGNGALQGILKSITLKKDDNVEVDYLNESGGLSTDIYGKYKVLSKKDLLYYPDIDKMLKDVDGIDNATLNEMKELSKLGIPFKYSLGGSIGGSTLNEVYFYLDTKTIKAMKILFTALESSIKGDTAKDLVLKAVLKAMPAALDKTDKIEIGLGFNKKN